MNQPLAPGLYIVATPIGNLGDVTARAAETLCRVDRILAEDKRVTAKLLAHLGATAPMTAYHDHSDDELRQRILAEASVKAIALVSDAGTPLISDPGYKLVRAARAAGDRDPHPARPVRRDRRADARRPADRPLPVPRLPLGQGQGARRRHRRSRQPARQPGPLRKRPAARATASPRSRDGLGDRAAAVIREITKLHEECVTGTLAELAARYADAPPRGEIVIVVGPPAERGEASDDDARRRAARGPVAPVAVARRRRSRRRRSASPRSAPTPARSSLRAE